ncbi:hypothetical protein P3547_19950 [Vibrio parahaemolyticus]|nr:hypothetical protein [Vibrio parahaemolyticus]
MRKERLSETDIQRHREAFELITEDCNNMYTKMSRLHRYLKEYARNSCTKDCSATLKQSAVLFSHARRTDEAFKRAFTKVMSIDETLTMQDVELVLARTIVIHRQVADYTKKLTASEYI